MIKNLAEKSGMTQADVKSVLSALEEHIVESVKKGEAVKIGALLKIAPLIIPAREAATGVPNPFKKGETMDVAARPELRKLKVIQNKKLKDAFKEWK